jgi:hypothetical protein
MIFDREGRKLTDSPK